jgi:hypothetical protein
MVDTHTLVLLYRLRLEIYPQKNYRNSAVLRKSKLPPGFNVTFVSRVECTTSLFGYHNGIAGRSLARIYCTSI